MNHLYTALRLRLPPRIVCSIAAIILISAPAHAACPDDAAVGAYMRDFDARRANDTFSNGLTLEEAACARRKLMAAFPASLGQPIGYRAAFTNDLTRALLRFDQPIWGAMYGRHVLPSPATVSVKYGAAPYWDPDLLVEVSGPGLADAKTPLEALRHISAVIPFIGLKDNITGESESVEHFTAINAGFRSGVAGRKIPVAPTRRFLDSMAKMTVVTTQNNQVLAQVKGGVLMGGQPIRAAMWLAGELKKAGIVLKPGDLLALGGFAPAQPPMRDASVEVQYIGLPGDPVITVRFE
jgi:2-oxo-hept-3-ene-1,7-dioate hydratase